MRAACGKTGRGPNLLFSQRRNFFPENVCALSMVSNIITRSHVGLVVFLPLSKQTDLVQPLGISEEFRLSTCLGLRHIYSTLAGICHLNYVLKNVQLPFGYSPKSRSKSLSPGIPGLEHLEWSQSQSCPSAATRLGYKNRARVRLGQIISSGSRLKRLPLMIPLSA